MFPQKGKENFLCAEMNEICQCYAVLWLMSLIITSPFRDSVTRIKYTMDILNADSSIAALSSPSVGVMETVLNSSGKTYCNYRAYQVRMLWMTDMEDLNTTAIESAVSKAWISANNGKHTSIIHDNVYFQRNYDVSYYVCSEHFRFSARNSCNSSEL